MRPTLRLTSRTGALRRSWIAFPRLACALIVIASVSATLTATSETAWANGISAPRNINATQELAALRYEHRVYRAPRTNAGVKSAVPPIRPITGEQTTLPVVAQSTDRHGQRWLKVMLPGRPNSSTGWIKRAGTDWRSTSWNIQVNLAARHIWVYFEGHLTRSFSAVVGKPSTPTPTGRFFVEETLIMPVSEPGGPFALATSARSNVLQEFDGGPGQIAIHGRDGLGGTPGQAESHGCMRLATPNIDWLAARIGPGTPVTIR